MQGISRKLVAVLTASVLLAAAMPWTALGETDNAVSAEGNDSVIDYSGRQNGFAQYLKSVADRPYAAVSLTLSSATAALSEENALADQNASEDKTAPLLQSGGWMEWSFTAEESAIYQIRLTYQAGAGKGRKPEIKLELDGKIPYTEFGNYALNRVYRDKTEILKNAKGDELIPEQEEVARWQTVRLADNVGLTGQYLCLYIEKGTHTLRLGCESESVYIDELSLLPKLEVPSNDVAKADYAQSGFSAQTGFLKTYQAEKTLEKSDVMLYPMYDRTSAAVEPYHPTQLRRNTIGRSNWSENGMWISYQIDDIPADGLYYITLKYRQSDAVGVTTFRNIYVNGEIPSEAFHNVAFPYGVDWNLKTIIDEQGEPCPFFLKKGSNEIRLEVSLGTYFQVLQSVDEACYKLNQLYTQMVMITGTKPDTYRDYYLDKEIPGLLESFTEQAANLNQAADLFDRLSGEKSSESETIRTMARRLDSMVSEPRTIHTRLSSYRNGVSGLSSWLEDRTYQPLELDYLIVHTADSTLPSPRATFWAQVKHIVQTFLASFFQDYSTIGADAQKDAITVWVNLGRDQAQVIKNLTLDSFTSKAGIGVNLSVVQTGFIEATLAGQGPDVALDIERGQPVNLACRGALLDFDSYAGFTDMQKRFTDTALVPYQFQGKTYAIPCRQRFFMMFYRKDILAQMNIAIPETWDDIYAAVPKLQRSHMTIGLPYAIISAATAVNNGLGAKDLFATLLLQNGGEFYTEDYTATKLDSEASMQAFKTWCDFYTKYGFDLAYDFYTRFTIGEMPIGIASYEMVNTLSMAAEEIRGLWGMAPMPGTRDAQGQIHHTEAGAGTAAVIFKKTKSPEACFQFVDWWTSDEIQTKFCTTMENLLGVGGRYETANLTAFSQQPWTDEELAMLSKQREEVVELPEIPGSYYVTRSIDNAFRAVLYDQKNPREIFEKENRNINREILRKRRELGLTD